MHDFMLFSDNLKKSFGNDKKNFDDFNDILISTSREDYSKYNAKESNTIIRNQFNNIFGGDFSKMSKIHRLKVWRDHRHEVASLIEETLQDKQESGWNEGNARFMDFVEERTIGIDDELEFYVEDNSLMTVSKFAGNHHDINLNNYACLYSIRVA